MSKLRWSKNVLSAKPPILMSADEFDPRERAYPFIGVEKRPDENYAIEAPPILVDAESVTFRGQRGPVAEEGINGCQIDDILVFCLGTLQTFNKKFACRENSLAITKLQEALMWLEERTRNREARGVEGYDKE